MAASCLACQAGEQSAPRPNLVLVLIDTLRADHVGAYGYERNTTPVIDELARTGLRFELAVSQSSWTLPSLMSLFTARHPPDLPGDGRDIRQAYGLDQEETTLAEQLRAAGYRTISVATNPYNVDEIFRLMQGFEERVFEISAPASWVVDRALEKLDAVPADRVGAPFFLYLHLMDVHTPYAPPPPYDRMFAPTGGAARAGPHRDPAGATGPDELESPAFLERRSHSVALYDGALRFADAQLGRLLEHLAVRGLHDTTVLAIASDHGEAFWERVELERTLGLHSHGRPGQFGVGHGHTVFRELVSVPLIFNGPGIRPGVAPGPVRNLDLAPTLLAIAGLPADDLERDGVDLLGRAARPLPPALSETRRSGRLQRSLVTGRRQLVRIDAALLLFDTARSGWPRVEAAPDTQADLSRELDAVLEGVRRVRIREGFIDRETLEALRALGYLE
jgi:arylsulfatase A-like enzyme